MRAHRDKWALGVAVLSLGCNNLMPGSKGSASNGTNRSGAVTRQTHEMFFPIAVGVHGGADCNQCHGGFPTFQEFSCVGCHEHEQTVADPQHAGVANYQFDSKACLMCHPSGQAGEVSRADHTTKFFPIDTASTHATNTCTDCHTNPADKTQFTCTGCHDHAPAGTDPVHVGVSGYSYDSAACLKCHPAGTAGTISRAEHTAKFFAIDAASKHATNQCADCHTNPADKAQFTCTGCHDHAQAVTDPKHMGIAGYSYDSAACLKCHPTGAAGTLARADHTKFFPIDVGAKHASGQCTDCHTNPNDRTQFTCLSCHDHAQPVTDPAHANIAGYGYDSAACLKCHADGTAKFDHSTLGATPNCIGCHRDKLGAAVTTPASNHNANMFPTNCEACHRSFTAWGPMTAMQHDAVGGVAAKCETCHLGDFKMATTPFSHSAIVASTCNSCHKDFTTWMQFVHSSNCYNGTTGRSHHNAKCAQCHADPTNYKTYSCTACHGNRGTNCNGG
jgi:hypothetical protein